MLRRLRLWCLAALLLCGGCSSSQTKQESSVSPAAPESFTPEAPQPSQEPLSPEGENSSGETVLLMLEATVDGSRTLRLEAVGRLFPTDYGTERYGVRTVRVYEGTQLLQTIDAQEAIEAEWGTDGWMPAEDGFLYTDCWTPEDALSVQDMNFDGSEDLALFGWIPNNSIPYYHWLWNPDTQNYRYAFTLQQAEPHPETRQVSSWYKVENGIYHTDYYQYDSAGMLIPVRRQVENWQKGTGDLPLPETYEWTGSQWLLTETEEVHG